MALSEIMNILTWERTVSSRDISLAFRAAEIDLRDSVRRATSMDGHLNALQLMIRSRMTRTGGFTTPASILGGGVIREVAGVVTLPETRRIDAVHAADGAVRATARIAHGVAEVSTSENPEAIFDTDTATAWEIHISSPIIPSFSFPELGEVEGGYFAIQVSLDIPQTISQAEIGLIGDPAILFRIECAETGTIIWSGEEWVDPGALVFFPPVRTQSLILHFLQPHGLYDGSRHHYHTAISSLGLYEIEYEEESRVELPTMTISSTLLRPLVRGHGRRVLEIHTQDGWREVGEYFMLPLMEARIELPVSLGNSIHLPHVPEQIVQLLGRRQTGQALPINLASVRHAGNVLYLDPAESYMSVLITYRYRPVEVNLRIHLRRDSEPWISPVVKEVKLT